MDIYDRRHQELLLPVVRIRTGKAMGSGTVIYSGEAPDGSGRSTYVLTNHHVIESLLAVKEEWSSLLQRNVKRDVRGMAEVDFYEYRWASRAVGATTIQADIVAYDKNEDLALLHLRSGREVPSVARMFPRGRENTLRASMPVFCVGAGLGESPVMTQGMLSQFGIQIENREFWLNTAPAIYGNSGGALFLADTHEFVGVPARIAVTWGNPITHLQYAIPITRVYNFLEEQRFRFIYDSQFTEQGELEEQERLRRRDERARLLAVEEGGEKPSA